MSALPVYHPPQRGDKDTDFNDSHRLSGPEAVRRAVAEAKAPPPPDGRPSQENAPNAILASPLAPETEAAPAETGYVWPEPEPLGGSNAPDPYPLDAWPGIAGGAVREVLEFVQCPPALAAHGALAAMSTVCQGLANVKRGEGLEGPISLYLLILCESGERKSAVDRLFMRGIREWDAERRERDKATIREYISSLDAWKAKREGLLSRIRKLAEKGNGPDAAKGKDK